MSAGSRRPARPWGCVHVTGGEPAPRHARWALAVVLTVLVPGLLLVVQEARYLFHGDTPAAYCGWWYHLGREVLHGRWPLIDPHAWHAGEPRRRGPVGLCQPLTVGIGVLADRRRGNVLVLATAVKLALACVGALGVFAPGPLVRRRRRRVAYVAAVAVPLGGMTQYLDLPLLGGRPDDLGAAALGVVGAAPHHAARGEPAGRAGARLPAGHAWATSTARSC